jgi:hypothetical protein
MLGKIFANINFLIVLKTQMLQGLATFGAMMFLSRK